MDGSFPLGGAVCAVMISQGINPWLATLAGTAGGGNVTAATSYISMDNNSTIQGTAWSGGNNASGYGIAMSNGASTLLQKEPCSCHLRVPQIRRPSLHWNSSVVSMKWTPYDDNHPGFLMKPVWPLQHLRTLLQLP